MVAAFVGISSGPVRVSVGQAVRRRVCVWRRHDRFDLAGTAASCCRTCNRQMLVMGAHAASPTVKVAPSRFLLPLLPPYLVSSTRELGAFVVALLMTIALGVLVYIRQRKILTERRRVAKEEEALRVLREFKHPPELEYPHTFNFRKNSVEDIVKNLSMEWDRKWDNMMKASTDQDTRDSNSESK
ncbi:hypothetical protein FVE85_9280 [Porphyridium purpureum]|uniref:Uncharacterized protein n=1 Tax=Porphyridium purpureum TaxID=35688 RepID=A0A5J4YNY2_PORPP|nr:hypothetical protein FVE85_9280 [Porphyridium purpureum]|eukprot:POR8814..scf222_8